MNNPIEGKADDQSERLDNFNKSLELNTVKILISL